MLRLATLSSLALSLSWLLIPIGAARADEPVAATSAEAAPSPSGPADASSAPTPGDDDAPAPPDPPETALAPRIDHPFSAAVEVAPASRVAASSPHDEPPAELPPIATRNRARITPLPGYEPPPGYVLATANRRGIWGGGIGVAAGTYAISTISAGLLAAGYGDKSILTRGCLPIIGSFLMAGEDLGGFATGMGIALGVGQLAGVSMILGGAIGRRQVWLREDLARPNLRVSAGPGGGSLAIDF